MITSRGAALVATAAFTFFLARLTQVGWLYLLDAMLWGVILLSVVLPWLTVMSLVARRKLVRRQGSPGSPGPAEGETVQVELCLENRRPWPRYFLSASYNSPLANPDERGQRFFVSCLDARASLALVSTVDCYRRGPHKFGPVDVESKAPFGLFRRRRRLSSPLSVLVYPQVFPLNRLALLEGTQGTALRPQRTRLGQEIAGSRNYVPGDPMRHVHWRNTARMGRPMVKEFEDTQENTLVITFDSSQDLGQERETVLEYSIKLAASVARYMIARGGSVRLLTGRLPGQDSPWPQLLKELALLEAGQGPGLGALVASLTPGTRVLALVSEQDSAGVEALTKRSGQMAGLAVVVLEGFGDSSPQSTGLAVEKLRLARVPVVSCR